MQMDYVVKMVLWLSNKFLHRNDISTLANECHFCDFFNVRNVYRQILQSLFSYLLLFQFFFSIFLILSLRTFWDFLPFDFSNLLLISAVLSSFTAFPTKCWPTFHKLHTHWQFQLLCLLLRMSIKSLFLHYLFWHIYGLDFHLNNATFGNPLQNFHNFL